MFKNLSDFGTVRSTAQAIGFYFTYLCVAVVIAMMVGITVGMMTPAPGDFNQGIGMGAITSAVICALLTFFVLKHKNRLGDSTPVVLVIVSVALALLGGGLLGMIVPSYLTTQKKNN